MIVEENKQTNAALMVEFRDATTLTRRQYSLRDVDSFSDRDRGMTRGTVSSRRLSSSLPA